ncbi:DUF6894 family protein [Microvirga massiliensis]|uniref:DUF6894 family protein n=1 Tax=Microvirga massiliensis TaxID=1033741 RepID=UPI00062B8AE9|nr:hypothetical protein [Microvirga massiliensis]
MVKRYYFHLVDQSRVIPDEVGIEVASLAQARLEAVKAVHEFRQECAPTAAAWRDWRIEVTDACGAVAFRIDLGEPAANSWEHVSRN